MSKKDLFYESGESPQFGGSYGRTQAKAYHKRKRNQRREDQQELFNHARTCYYHRFDLHPYWFVEVVL